MLAHWNDEEQRRYYTCDHCGKCEPWGDAWLAYYGKPAVRWRFADPELKFTACSEVCAAALRGQSVEELRIEMANQEKTLEKIMREPKLRQPRKREPFQTKRELKAEIKRLRGLLDAAGITP